MTSASAPPEGDAEAPVASATLYGANGRVRLHWWGESLKHLEQRLTEHELSDVVQADASAPDGTRFQYVRASTAGRWSNKQIERKAGE